MHGGSKDGDERGGDEPTGPARDVWGRGRERIVEGLAAKLDGVDGGGFDGRLCALRSRAERTKQRTGDRKPAQVFKWKMVTTWPKNYPVLGTSPERFAEAVERMSAGRLKIKVYGAGELVPALGGF